MTRDGLQMHEVTEAATCAFSHLILSAAGLPEVCDGRQLGVNGPGIEPPIVQVFHALLSIFFSTELDIDVAHQMVTQVIAHVHLLDFPVLVFQLCKHLLEELIIMLLHLHITQGNVRAISSLCAVLWVQVQVGDTHCLTESGFVVKT